MAPPRQSESVSRKPPENKPDIEFLLYGMDREIKTRPELMMVELEELCSSKKKGTRSSENPEQHSYMTLLKINGMLMHDLAESE